MLHNLPTELLKSSSTSEFQVRRPKIDDGRATGGAEVGVRPREEPTGAESVSSAASTRQHEVSGGCRLQQHDVSRAHEDQPREEAKRPPVLARLPPLEDHVPDR